MFGKEGKEGRGVSAPTVAEVKKLFSSCNCGGLMPSDMLCTTGKNIKKALFRNG